MTSLPKISPNRRRSIAVLNQGSTAHSAPQRRRRAYSIAPGDKLSPVTRARRLRAPRKSILKQSLGPSESQDDTLSTSGETTESRRVSFAAHAHVFMFDNQTKVSTGTSNNNKRRQSRGGEPGDQQTRFADDNGEGQENNENIDPQTGTQRRKSVRRRSSTAFSEYGERSMDLDDEDEEGAPANNFLDEYLGEEGEEEDWGEEDEDYEGEDDMGMDITEAIDPRILRKRSLSLGGAQQIGRRRSSALPTMTSSLRNSENQPPLIEESEGEQGEDDDTGRYDNHNADDYTTSSSGNTTSFMTNEGSSGEATHPMEFTIPINKSLRKPASQDDLWQQLRAVTHAGATEDPNQSQDMEEEPYEEGAVIPLEEFEHEDTTEPMELTTALDRLMKARASMGIGATANGDADGQGYDDMEEDSYLSSNGSFGMDGNETINVTAMMRNSLGGHSSLMDETNVFGGIQQANGHHEQDHGDQSVRMPVNGQGRESQPQPQPQPQAPPDPEPSSSVFKLPRVFSAPSSQTSQGPSPIPAPPNPSPSQTQASTSTSIASTAFTFSRPLSSNTNAPPQSPARPSSVTKPTQSSLAKRTSPSKIPKPIFRASAAFAPPTTPKSPKKRAALGDDTTHDPEDRPSPSKKQAVDKLQPNPNKKRVSFYEPDPNAEPDSPEPSVPTHATGARRASILRRPQGYFAQRKSLAPGSTKTVTGLNVQKKVGRASLGSAPAQDSAPISLYPDISRILEEDPPTPQRNTSPRASSPATVNSNGITHSEQQTTTTISPPTATANGTGLKTSPTSAQALGNSVFRAPQTSSSFGTSLYPQIPDDLRTQDLDLTNRSDLLGPGEDSTEPINPEQWRNGVQDEADDEGPPISIEQFFDMTKIRFMDEIAAPRRSTIHPNQLGQRSRRRSLNSSTNGTGEAEDVPLAEFVTTLSVELPQLELYSTIAGELHTWIEESKKMCREADEEAVKMTPGLFREFAMVDDGEREFLIHQLKLIKAYCHGMARSQWYDWRKTWTEQLQAAADEAFGSLESDAVFLEGIRKETSAMLPSLREEYAQVMAELEKEQADIAEIEEQDQDMLNELKATIADQDLVIEGYSTDLSESKAKLERLEEKLAEIEAQKQEALDAISQAQQMVHIQKESTSAEVFRLKDELDALEILHQWQTTKLTPSLVEFIYAGRFTVTIPCIKFKPLPARISIQRTKASRSERDSFPQFTEMMVKGALKHVSQMPGPTLRRTVQQLSDFWSAGTQLRRQLELLNIRYPLSVEFIPGSGDAGPSVVATATIMLETVKSKAFISFPLDLDICSQWPRSTNLLKADVQIAYGKADGEMVRKFVQNRLDEVTPSDNYCCLLDACLVAKEQYD